LWMRLVGAVCSGWLGDRVGRRIPLMISILWYSLCNFIAGFSPTFWFLFVFRALLGFGMGAEWPAGAALAMESWPVRSRGFMSGILQGSWGIGFLLSSAAYGLLYNSIGWRGLLWLGILPALTVVYVRYFVKEPPVWVENRRRQREENREVRLPLFSIFKRGMIGNTLLACWWMAGGLVTYYWVIVIGYVLQGALLGGGAGSQVPSYMTERFPTEARATASAFCYHLGTIFGGIVPPVITYFAVDHNLGFSLPMLVGCVVGGASWCIALYFGPETRGKEMSADLVLA